MAAKTRLGLYGGPQRAYGAFSAKPVSLIIVPLQNRKYTTPRSWMTLADSRAHTTYTAPRPWASEPEN